MQPDLSNDDGRLLLLICRFSNPVGLGLRYNAFIVLVLSVCMCP